RDAGAIAKNGGLLYGRLNVRKAMPVELEILDQRAMAHSHIEIGMQIEPETGKNVGVGAAAASDTVVAFEHRDAQPGLCQVSRKRQAIVTCADDDSVELRHVALVLQISATGTVLHS